MSNKQRELNNKKFIAVMHYIVMVFGVTVLQVKRTPEDIILVYFKNLILLSETEKNSQNITFSAKSELDNKFTKEHL